jgi:outer membrane lipoprotein SlyB
MIGESKMRALAQLASNAWNRAICDCSGRWRKGLLAMVPLLLSTNVLAQPLIKVSQSAWLALTPTERASIQQKYIVDLAEQDAFGIIIDNQGVNESTLGTNVGANLGGAVANAAYVDNALRGGNYSAVNQLAVGILGAMVGSTLDSRPNAQYHFRYAVKLGNGDIKYFDETKRDPFRHPVGVCVSVPYIALIEQQLCMQTAAFLRTTYLQMPTTQAIDVVPTANPISVENPVMQGVVPDAASAPNQVNCKLGTLAPVRTSAEKCALINGSQVQ